MYKMTRFAARAFLFSLLIIPALMDQAQCQTLAAPLQDANPQFLDCRGVGNAPCPPLAGGKLTSYAAGTTTPLATCATTTLSGANCATPNANPVILNSYGYNAAGSGTTGIWPLPARCYKFKLTDSSNVTIWTIDNVCNQTGILQAALAGGSGAAAIGYTFPGGSARTVQTRLQDSVSIKDFGAKVDSGLTNNATAFQSAVNSICANGGGTVNIPNTNNSATYYGFSSGITIACDNVTIEGNNAKMVTTQASGNFITASGDRTNLRFQHLNVRGNNSGGTYGINFGNGLLTTATVSESSILNFGNSSGGGAGIRIGTSTFNSPIKITHNDLSGNQIGVDIEGPSDDLEINENIIYIFASSVNGPCINIGGTGSGAGVQQIRHNAFACKGGAVQAISSPTTTGGQWLIDDNEFELNSDIPFATPHSAVFDLQDGNFIVRNNSANAHGNAAYAYYVGDRIFNSVFALNQGCGTTDCWRITENFNGQNGNLFLFNLGDPQGIIPTYSNTANVSGIMDYYLPDQASANLGLLLLGSGKLPVGARYKSYWGGLDRNKQIQQLIGMSAVGGNDVNTLSSSNGKGWKFKGSRSGTDISTTAAAGYGSLTITVASAAGILNGQHVSMSPGFLSEGTTVDGAPVGTTVTLSAPTLAPVPAGTSAVFSTGTLTGCSIADDGLGTITCDSGVVSFGQDIKSIEFIGVPHTPSTSSETCSVGTWAQDTDYIYICTSANTWKRSALSAF